MYIESKNINEPVAYLPLRIWEQILSAAEKQKLPLNQKKNLLFN